MTDYTPITPLLHPHYTPVSPDLGKAGAKPRKTVIKPAPNGFSLVEMMVVLLIIGLLAAVVIINVMPSQDKAMTTKAEADIATLGQAMEMYRLDNFNYPGAADGLAALRSPPASLTQPQNYRPGGYIKTLPEDPWGRPYQLQVPGRDGRPFDIFSLGADGQPGGSDNNADIYSGGL